MPILAVLFADLIGTVVPNYNWNGINPINIVKSAAINWTSTSALPRLIWAVCCVFFFCPVVPGGQERYNANCALPKRGRYKVWQFSDGKTDKISNFLSTGWLAKSTSSRSVAADETRKIFTKQSARERIQRRNDESETGRVGPK